VKRFKRAQRLEASQTWTPFERAVVNYATLEKNLPTGITVDDALKFYEGAELWKNNRYEVTLHRYGAVQEGEVALAWLSIKRLDRRPIHDWRDLQRIKNEIIGAECEGVELYPAESRKVDTSNQFHMYVVIDPTWRWPFGFRERLVMDEPGGNAKQRPGASFPEEGL
jgi:hypothetical protein